MNRYKTPIRVGSDRRAGLTLVELVVAVSIFTVIALGVALTLMRGMEHSQESALLYRGLNELRDRTAEIQEIANLPQDLVAQEGIGAVYGRYHNQNFAVAALPSGNILVTCFPNEAAVPAILGGPQDLNFDGDAADDLGNQSAGTDLRLVPMTMTLTFVEKGNTQTITMQRLITKTTD